jgi:predicted nucleic acid-binding Zn ribbon protein
VVEKVGQHRHCRNCEKAIQFKDEFCDEKCEADWKTKMTAKKRQLIYFYGLMVVIMVLAVFLMLLG